MITTILARIRASFSGLFRRGQRGDLSPRRDWALLCIFFAGLALVAFSYSAVLFVRAEYAGMESAPEEITEGVVRTIDRKRLGEAVDALRRLRAAFNETEKVSSSVPLPE